MLTSTDGVDSDRTTLEDAFSVLEEQSAVANGDLDVGSGKTSSERAGWEPVVSWPVATQTQPMKWISKTALLAMLSENISDEKVWHAHGT